MAPDNVCPQCCQPLPEGAEGCPGCQAADAPGPTPRRGVYTLLAMVVGAFAGLVAISAICLLIPLAAPDDYGVRELAGSALILLALPATAAGAAVAGIVTWRRMGR